MPEFEFVDELPTLSHTRGPDQVLIEFAAALRANPGRWAKWPRQASVSTARQIRPGIRTGRYRSLPPGEFEGTCRDGVAYVRFIGEETANA